MISNESEPGKRTLIGMVVAFGVLTTVVVSVSLAANTQRARAGHEQQRQTVVVRDDQVDPKIVEYLGPMATTRRFDSWRIMRIDPMQFGRLTLEIEGNEGGRFVVDVHARSPEAPSPIAETSHVALYLRTNQRGGQTPRAFADACSALARALREREEAGHAPPPLDRLVTR